MDHSEPETEKRFVVIIGCGFVADLYMRSIELHPDIEILGAFDIRRDRMEEFCKYWNLKSFSSF